MISAFKEKYIGTKDFYQKTARIAVPLAVQNMLMSCMSMVDTLMVSWIGMVSAVGTAAQLDILSGTISYGIIGGVGMFASQFFGAEDEANLKRCTGLSLLMVFANALVWFLIATFFSRQFLSFYINDMTVVENGMKYLRILRFSLITGSISFCMSNMFRSTQQPKVALYFSTGAGILNMLLNYVLIFGVGPFPEMGVEGAALGTVISSAMGSCGLILYAIYTKQAFLGTLKEMFGLKGYFVKPILSRIYPLIVNETIFSIGQTLFIKAFGALGKAQMDAYYVGNQIFNVMTFVIYGYGSAVQILLGTLLGKGDIEQAKKECNYHIGFAFGIAILMVSVLVLFAKPMVGLFQMSDPNTEALAISIVYVLAVKVSMRLYNFMIFCILRSGGDAKIIQFLDAGIEWLVGLPAAFMAVYVFGIQNLAIVLLIAQVEQLVRLVLGMKRVRSYKWANDLTTLVANA